MLFRSYIPGEWISVWQVELPDVARKQIPTILPALLEEELNQDIDELHFALPAIAASTTSGRGVETPSAVMRPEVLITCFKWYFSKIEGMFRAPLFGQIAFARADRGQRHQNVVSLQALFFSIHQQRGPVLQAK